MLLREFRRKADRLADYLPWSHLLRPDVVALKDGAWLAGFSVQAPDLDSAEDVELVAHRARLASVFAQLGGGWPLWVEARRLETPGYPLSCDPAAPEAVRLLDEERRREFSGRTNLSTELLVWLSFYGLRDSQLDRSASLVMDEGDGGMAAATRAAWSRFLDRLDQIEGLLADVMIVVRRLEGDGLVSALASAIAPEPLRVKAPSTPVYLDGWLATADLLPGTRPMLGDHHFRLVSVRDLPGETSPALLDVLSRAPFACRWCSRWLALDAGDARRLMRLTRRRWQAKAKPAFSVLSEMIHGESSQAPVDPEALLMIEDSDQALASLAQSGVAYGLYSASLIVSDPDPAIADARANELLRLVIASGVPARRKGLGAADAWLGAVPGDVKAHVRRFPLHSASLVDLLPATGTWTGHPFRSIAMARTKTGASFKLGLHGAGSDVGHTAVLGPTGAVQVCLSVLSGLELVTPAGGSGGDCRPAPFLPGCGARRQWRVSQSGWRGLCLSDAAGRR
ncbi:MAG: hypothetical protein ACFB6S_10265 [Geminicoccaceae bacterium]